MEFVIIFVTVLLSANAFVKNDEWENFKIKYGKSYENKIEEHHRYSVYLQNLETIARHNAKYDVGKVTYTLGVNKFADLTDDEFKMLLGLQKQNMPTLNGKVHQFPEGLTIPDSIDWREKGAVVDVKDQENCGSCWAFSAVGAVEGQNFIKNKQLISLSEQELMDCSKAYGNGNCTGSGTMVKAFNYLKDKGIGSEDDYPYQAKSYPCLADTVKRAVNISSYVEIQPNETAILNAVGSIGPISAGIYSDPFRLYSGGIFNDTECHGYHYLLNHGVLIVGYGEENDKPFWIVKNSWGKLWGEDGYIRIARGCNRCGISLKASYPLL